LSKNRFPGVLDVCTLPLAGTLSRLDVGFAQDEVAPLEDASAERATLQERHRIDAKFGVLHAVQFHRDAVSRGGGISSSPAGDAYKALH
jgi:hypothetical protein